MKWTRKLPNFLTRTVRLMWARKPGGKRMWTLGLQVNLENGYISRLKNEGFGQWSVVFSLVWWALILDVSTGWDACERVEGVMLSPGFRADVWRPAGDTLTVAERGERQFPHLAVKP